MDGGDSSDRSVSFDAWLSSRSGALTRFAYLLTGSEVAADRALSVALARACLGWSRLRRSDDPEWEVRRLVVAAWLPPRRRTSRRATPPVAVRQLDASTGGPPPTDDVELAWRTCAGLTPEQRTAVVLRCYAEQTYPRIGAALEVKESRAIALLGEAFAALGTTILGPRTDERLEAAFVETFAAHADDPAEPGDRLAVAKAAAGRLRRRRLVPAVAAAAAVLAVGSLVFVQHDDASPSTAAAARAHPSGWRAESYDGIQLWVPGSWGWGEVPRRGGEGLVTCEFGAYAASAATSNLGFVPLGPGPGPYVGRPVAVVAHCPQVPASAAAHVWFDSPLAVGSDPAQTTVRVGGIRALHVAPFNVTVADPNREQRATILGSLEPVTIDADGCPRTPVELARVQPRPTGVPSPAQVRSLAVCLFATGTASPEMLFSSTRIEGSAARAATASLERATTAPNECLVTPALQHAALIARTADGFTVFDVNNGGCAEPWTTPNDGSRFQVLSDQSVRRWATDGLTDYAATRGDDVRLRPLLPAR